MEIKRDQDIRESVQPKNQFIWLGSYITALLICLAVYVLLHFNVIKIYSRYDDLVEKLAQAGFFGVLVLTASKTIEILIVKRSGSRYRRYNLVRLTHLVSLIAVGFILVSFLFTNWYAAAVSLGLFSLILGFALQTPISSFIGWMYIIIRVPYRIGDRIQIDTFRGDVIEIGYLDTTLWEFGGDYLTNDLPSGRLIRFPNSLVFASPVFNYSWRNFPYIWNEIPFHVAYESDLDHVEKTIREVAQQELGEEMEQKIEQLKTYVRESPVSDIQIREYPFVSWRINNNTWAEAMLTYLVDPKQAATTRTRIIKKALAELNKQPDKTMFPKSNAR